MSGTEQLTSAAALTQAVLDEEGARIAAQAQAEEARVLPDEELPGVGDAAMSLRQAVRVGGLALLSVLALLNAVDQLDTGAVSILAPDIKDSLHTSNGVIAVATVGGTLFMVAGGLVLGRLADMRRRTTIIGIATLAWGVLVLATSAVTNALSYFVARALTGVGRSNTQVVQGPVLADAYPIPSRARVYAVHGVAGRVGGLIAPLAVGGLVTLIGGTAAWRWGFVAIATIAIAIGIVSFFLPDPPRGQFEQKDTIGEVISTEGAPPISLGASYQRIMKIKTYRSTLVAFTALGFGLVSVPVYVNLYLDEHFGLDAFQRALIMMIPGVLTIVVLPLVAKRFDVLFRTSPPRALVLIGGLFIPAGVLIALQMAMPTAWLFAVFAAIGGVILAVQLTMVGPLFAAANPYYLRAQGTAIGMAIILGIGGFGGAVLGGLLDEAFGLRVSITLLGVTTNIIGGVLMINGARFLRNDMSLVVEEIRELETEHLRLLENPDDIPVLQLRNIDFSYGPVQVLFDVQLDVRRGETLALLGTNGAGKSTVLRVVSGLGIPSRGVVRLNGHNVALCSAETRVKWGIHQLAGGNAIFAPMSVRENLEMAGFLYRGDDKGRRERSDRALSIFPELAGRLHDTAGLLSGGQQQMLGLAMVLMHDPEILLIDELSLGLAPVMVESLLSVVERLKREGQTMIIVEQSLNVALEIAERAVFMEKGRICFEGPSAQLLERDDLVRAVFLGSEHGELVIAGITITRQVVYDGFIDGLAIGLLALGVVLIYRSSRVINFAVGALGSFSAALLALLVIQYDWSFWPAAIVAVAAGGVFAAAVELTVITRLFRAPRVIVLVATIGIAELALAAQTALPHVDEVNLNTPYPTPITGTWTIAGIRVRGAELSVLIAVPLITVALTWFLTRTDLGIAVRAAAANPDRARLSAINPKLLSTLVWTIGGLLAAVSLIVLAGTAGSAVGLTTIGPNTLSRALAAALIARMVSFPRALAAGIAIGVVQAVVKYNTPTQTGVFDAALFMVVLIATWLIARTAGADDDASFSFAPRTKPIPERLRQIWWVRVLPRLIGALALMVAIVVPLVVTAPSRHFLYARVLLFAILALSLVVLTGWSGQVSLGQAAFAGIGALGFAALVNGNAIGLGYGAHRIDLDLPKFPPALALAIMTVVCALIATLIGAGALRVRGLLLAVVTFTFALAAQQYVFQRPFLSGGFGGSVFVERPVVGSIDFASQRAYYYLSLVGLTLAMILVARLRHSGVGRAMIGVRDNADSAAAYTVSPARTKLQSFALAGAIAGFGGALLGGLLSTISVGEVFTVGDSLQVVSIAVIGGVGSVAGPILGSLWVIGIPAFWPTSDLVPLLTSSVGLLVLLMYFPGGLIQIGYWARDAFFVWLDRRLPEAAIAPKPTAVPRARIEVDARTRDIGDVLVTQGVTVRFGGRVAVDDVAIRVGAHEVVGLIGTNGAGKTTLMNAIGGFVPSADRVEVVGVDVTTMSPARRARRGLGRTFQAARLFGDLTVRETLQIALEGRHRTSFTSTALFLPHGFRADRRQRADAEDIIAFLGLGRYAERLCAELSTGTRRIVELGALLALDARILCLDEPTAGIAQRETEAFGPLLLRIREELDASLLVIEHDMPLIMSISDRVYCMETGHVIAVGSPADVRENPAVIASYLGTDQRAIQRSGTVRSSAELPT